VVRFHLTKDNIYFANIEPDFDVLPLISKHFRDRYADQQWLIYDIKRKYGIYYNLDHVEMISLNLREIHFNKIHKSDAFLSEEYDYKTLLGDHFKNSGIKSLINLKLHKQHMPKQYGMYLSGKKEAV